MGDHANIVSLLNKFSQDHENITSTLKCAYSDGNGTTINQIKIFAQPGNRTIGIFSYRVETGMVLSSMYKKLRGTNSEGIIDALLDMMNYSKGQSAL